MRTAILKIFQAARLAWRDARQVFGALFKLAVIAFLIILALGVTQAVMLPRTPDKLLTVGALLLDFLFGAVQTFLITPYTIAVHRFVILGEVTTNYRLRPGERRFQRFFYWSLCLFLVSSAHAFIPFLPQPLQTSTAFLIAVWAVLCIAGWWGLRVIILFPAVAVDAAGATWRRAVADTKGYALDILFIILLAELPLALVDWIGRAATDIRSAPPLIGRVVQVIFNGAMELIFYTLAVVIASRLYEWLGDRVKRNPTGSNSVTPPPFARHATVGRVWHMVSPKHSSARRSRGLEMPAKLAAAENSWVDAAMTPTNKEQAAHEIYKLEHDLETLEHCCATLEQSARWAKQAFFVFIAALIALVLWGVVIDNFQLVAMSLLFLSVCAVSYFKRIRWIDIVSYNPRGFVQRTEAKAIEDMIADRKARLAALRRE